MFQLADEAGGGLWARPRVIHEGFPMQLTPYQL